MANRDLNSFDPATAGRYDPGYLEIFYDNRTYKGFDDKLPIWQDYWLQGLSRLSRPSLFYPSDIYPGFIQIVFYTVCLLENHCANVD